MKSCIITGANGYIGTLLVSYLSKDHHVIAVVRSLSNIDSILKNVEYIECPMENIHKLPEILKGRKVDCCIHLAWGGNSGDERSDYSLQLRNIDFCVNVIKTLSKLKIQRFIGVGTIAEKDVLAYHLTDGATPNSTSAYAAAKLSAHILTKIECNEYGIEHVWCTLGNTFGENNTTMNFVNANIKKISNSEYVDFTAGEQIYDFVYQDDAIQGIAVAAEHGTNNCSYYIGSGFPRPLKEYIIMMGAIVNPNCKLNLGAIPYNGKSLQFEDYSINSLNQLGYNPNHSFEDALKRTIQNRL